MRYILASQSPRRRELMGQLGISFEVEPANGEEHTAADTTQEFVENLAAAKAQEIKNHHPGEDVVVIGADTIVEAPGGREILGKPKDRVQMREMMKSLEGKTHQVYTGVAIAYKEQLVTFHECTYVTFYPMSDEELDAYASGSDGLDKAGGYGIQSDASVFVEKISGDYNNVVGLPVARLYHEMKKMSIL